MEYEYKIKKLDKIDLNITTGDKLLFLEKDNMINKLVEEDWKLRKQRNDGFYQFMTLISERSYMNEIARDPKSYKK
uniref:Uncharacterized protein n=1 Tax=viral metagenome TaxID=1070528 RepID=A0A6C0EAY8_9ZZZZ